MNLFDVIEALGVNVESAPALPTRSVRRHTRINASALNGTYRSYRRTCRRLHLKPVPRERAFGLIGEWTEVLSGRPEPTQH